MQENRDGTFGPILPVGKILKQAQVDYFNFMDETRAIHFGTEGELQEIKDRATVEQRLEKLEREFENSKPLKSDLILIPTKKQIKHFIKRVTA